MTAAKADVQDRREPSVDELRAVAAYAAQRVALYRRKILLGRGEPRQLAELERISDGAAGRLQRARVAKGTGQ
jgi:hypothetical protein